MGGVVMIRSEPERSEQLALAIAPSCRYRGCPYPVVGHSTQGDGHVCRGHNEQEWGGALIASEFWPEMGDRLLAAAKATLAREAVGVET
jgi:hypothetical protein